MSSSYLYFVRLLYFLSQRFATVSMVLDLEGQVVELDDVLHGHLVALFRRALLENAVQHFLRIGENRVAVRVIASPHERVRAGIVARLDADLVVLEGNAEVAL